MGLPFGGEREKTCHQPTVTSASTQTEASKTSHACLLCAATVIVVLSLVLEVQPGERVAIRGLSDYPLPQACYSRMLFGVKCPGCGLTRSCIHLAHGDWRAAWQVHRLGWLLSANVWFQFPYRIVLLAGGERLKLGPRFVAWFAGAVVGLLLANWGWQMFVGG